MLQPREPRRLLPEEAGVMRIFRRAYTFSLIYEMKHQCNIGARAHSIRTMTALWFVYVLYRENIGRMMMKIHYSFTINVEVGTEI